MSAGEFAWHPCLGPLCGALAGLPLTQAKSHGHFQMGLRGAGALLLAGTLVLGEARPASVTTLPPSLLLRAAVWSAHSLANTWNSPFKKQFCC